MLFQKAVKTEAKLRLAIAGPSGGGKTYTALAVASALGSRVAVLDTEHGSAAKYADLFEFDTLALNAPFHPDRYVEAIHAASSAGYDVLILDSLSHAWNGAGGLLELVDEIARRMKTVNTFAAWADATPIQNRLIEAMLAADIHIIATMRSKQDYVQDTDDRGRTRIRKVGMAPVQRDSLEYEFDVFLDMDIENNALVQKTRCPMLAGRVFTRPGADLAGILAGWLSGEPETVPPALAALREEFAVLGKKTYGDAWDDKRPELCLAASKQRTNNSLKVTADELHTLIDGMKKKANGNGQEQEDVHITTDAELFPN